MSQLPSGPVVPPDGPVTSPWLLVGEAPGATEVVQGRPFVGRSGQLLRRLVREVWGSDTVVRYTNVVKVRPPENRTPTQEEVREWWPRLLSEIEEMPDLRTVVCLGQVAAAAIFGRRRPPRGEPVGWNGKTVVATWHPAYCLRHPSATRELRRDLEVAYRHGAGELPSSWFWVGRTPRRTERAAVDVETWEDGRPRLVGVATEDGDAFVVRPDEFDPRITDQWTGHNVKVDALWLGRSFRPSDDTMVLAHLVDENRPVGLKDLLVSEGVAPYWHGIDMGRRDEVDDATMSEYCLNDVCGTLHLYGKLVGLADPGTLRVYREVYMPLVRELIEIEAYGVPVDVQYAADLEASLRAEAADVALPRGLNPASPQQVAKYLYGELGLPQQKRTPLRGDGSTDTSALQAVRHLHPHVDLLLRWRKLTKLAQMIRTWVERVEQDGVVRPSYNPAGTVTGRLSGRDPNPQNLPTDPRVRGIVRARPGHLIVWADYSTIELAVAAWLYDEERMLEAYRAGRDLHTETATAILGRPPDGSEERKKFGKTPNFGLLYMQSAEGFRDYSQKVGVHLTMTEAISIHTAWHRLYPRVAHAWHKIRAQVDEHGYVVAPSGRRRRLPDFSSTSPAIQNEAWRQAVNFPIQCTAAELTHTAAAILGPALRTLGGQLILHVHDSLVAEVPSGKVLAAAATMEGVMTADVPRAWKDRLGVRIPIPLRVEVSYGERWGGTV